MNSLVITALLFLPVFSILSGYINTSKEIGKYLGTCFFLHDEFKTISRISHYSKKEVISNVNSTLATLLGMLTTLSLVAILVLLFLSKWWYPLVYIVIQQIVSALFFALFAIKFTKLQLTAIYKTVSSRSHSSADKYSNLCGFIKVMMDDFFIKEEVFVQSSSYSLNQLKNYCLNAVGVKKFVFS